MQARDEALATGEGAHRRVGHARSVRLAYFESPGSTAPATLPTAFTVPTAASTARPAPVAATPTAVLATETTAHPPKAIDEKSISAKTARRKVGLLRVMP
jgi:hypothetical protein